MPKVFPIWWVKTSWQIPRVLIPRAWMPRKMGLYKPLPIQVEQLMLTSLGAWMNVHGAWKPPSMLSVEEWRHRGTMGRDHYVRVVYKGYLFPFGHRASLVKITERKFHPAVTHIVMNAAHLFNTKIDSHVKTIENSSHPEIDSFRKAINHNFNEEVVSLVNAIEGKSRREIASLVNASKRSFHKKTASHAKTVSDKFHDEIASLDNTAKGVFHEIVDSLVPAIKELPGNIAYLRQRMYIVVREPEKSYTNCGVVDYDQETPFKRVRITTLVTPDLDDPTLSGITYEGKNKGQSLFWPKVDKEDFQFHLIAEDCEGKEVEFTAPLLFAEQPCAINVDLMKYVKNNKYDSEKAYRSMNGQTIAFAESKKQGDTAFETQYLTFGANILDLGESMLEQKDIPCFYPAVKKAEVLIPSIKHLAGNNQTAEIKYYDDYLINGFGKGEVFAELVNEIKLDFNSQGDRSGGLVKQNMQIKGLSRLMGPVGGNPSLSNISGGTFDPKAFFAGLDAKIFGIINLWDVIKEVLPANFLDNNDQLSSKVPKLITDTSSDDLKVGLEWKPELKSWPEDKPLFIASNKGANAKLNIAAKLCVQSSGKSDVDISCALTDFSIDLIGNIESFIIIHFNKLEFLSKSGEKADVNVEMGDIEFVGVLSFVETLKDLIPLDGFNDPPSIDVTEQGISAGFSLGLPDIGIGVFSLQNLSLGASFTVPFIADPLSVRFNFCERQSPFLLTVSLFGGGGFFAITIDPRGVQLLEAAFEFGASLSVNLGVASGGVHIMAGIYFRMELAEDKAELTGYFRMGGEVDVLGIISASIELYLALHYEFSSGKCVGSATITIEVEVLLFSVSVEISCERKFAGSSGDPLFKDLMKPYPDPITGQEVKPWEEYCQAFA